MSNELIVRGNTIPTDTTNANQKSRKQQIDEGQWNAFMAVCGETYKLINEYRKQAAINAKMRVTQVDMLHRELKMLEAEFKDEKTTTKRRAEINQRVSQVNDYMAEALSKAKNENVGWWLLGGITVLCLILKAIRSLKH